MFDAALAPVDQSLRCDCYSILHIPRASASPSAAEDDIVIIGAHQDSTNLLPFLPAPGADDDGSGTITSLEALTLLLSSGFQPRNSSVEFHLYSAEEGGMLGSQAVASQYQREGKSVKAMLQMDMVRWLPLFLCVCVCTGRSQAYHSFRLRM